MAKFPIWKENLHWSKKIYALPRFRVFTLEKTYTKMGSPKTISVDKLFRDPRFQAGLINKFNAYGYDFTPYHGFNHVQLISTGTPLMSMVKMLKAERIDYLIDFPIFLGYYVEESQAVPPSMELRTIGIQEFIQKPIPTAYIAAGKSEFGKRIIERLDTTIDKKTILQIRDYVGYWAKEQETKKEFLRINKNLFGY